MPVHAKLAIYAARGLAKVARKFVRPGSKTTVGGAVARIGGIAGGTLAIGAVMPGGLRIRMRDRPGTRVGRGAGPFGLLPFPGEPRQYRRMNMGNPRALSRAIRRVEGAEKQYARLLTATRGIKCGGYTVKPKKRSRKCR